MTDKSEQPPVAFWDGVKLIHSDELCSWPRFPRFQDHGGLSYQAYREGAAKLRALKQKHPELVELWRHWVEIDNDEWVAYYDEEFPIPATLRSRRVQLPVPAPRRAHDQIEATQGSISDGELSVATGWFPKRARVTYSAPKRREHRDEFRELARKLSELSDRERTCLTEIQTSRFNHPVLFISHRWESATHPDPHGFQLKRLRQLRDCFIVYDYSSFPQAPMSQAERKLLALILEHMTALIRKVVILDAEHYEKRGWCIYEYLVSSLKGEIVCDEVRIPEFASLQAWCRTTPAFSFLDLARSSYRDQKSNYKHERMLASVDKILPHYLQSSFTVAKDRELVTELLRRALHAELPAIGTHQAYLGEFTLERRDLPSLSPAFEKAMNWRHALTMNVSRNRWVVPNTLEAAVRHGYQTMPMSDG